MKKGELSRLVVPGAEIAVRVTPKAARNAVLAGADGVKVSVTTVPEGGRANVAVRKLLAKALGVAPSRLDLIRGETSREKVFRILG